MFAVVDSWLPIGCCAARSGGRVRLRCSLSSDQIISIRVAWLCGIKTEQWTTLGAKRKHEQWTRVLRTSKVALLIRNALGVGRDFIVVLLAVVASLYCFCLAACSGG